MTSTFFLILPLLILLAIPYIIPWDHQILYTLLTTSIILLFGFRLVLIRRVRNKELRHQRNFFWIYSALMFLMGILLELFPFSPLVRLMLNGRGFIALASLGFSFYGLSHFIYKEEAAPKKAVIAWGLSGLLFFNFGFPLRQQLPELGGPYGVGTQYHQVEDQTRPEIFTKDPYDHRQLVLRFFYPIQKTAKGKVLAFKRSKRVLTHSQEDISPISDQQFPIIFLFFWSRRIFFR